ncbi:hypothetical protein [Candidatus Villigracilis affinis]|uniref:hypothetical protein n=1 Tax=Candidatus Villigracilis affinis TaxID=3140682 RepID=UPI001D7E5F9C|nr:hypothetical protein [Anaerolineales bacterium]
MFITLQFQINIFYLRLLQLISDPHGDDYGEKAVILVLVVLGGVAAFAAFGGKIVDLISQATTGI